MWLTNRYHEKKDDSMFQFNIHEQEWPGERLIKFTSWCWYFCHHQYFLNAKLVIRNSVELERSASPLRHCSFHDKSIDTNQLASQSVHWIVCDWTYVNSVNTMSKSIFLPLLSLIVLVSIFECKINSEHVFKCVIFVLLLLSYSICLMFQMVRQRNVDQMKHSMRADRHVRRHVSVWISIVA